jgi:hypothetical protein
MSKALHLVFFALLAGPALAAPDQMMPPSGGGGGGQYAARCEIDEILNGFELRVGDDVDGIRAICARALTPTSIAPRRLHASSTGGAGGRVVQVVCPDNTPAIASMSVGAEGQQTVIVNSIRLYCGIAAVNQLPEPYPTFAFDGPKIKVDPGFGTTVVMKQWFETQRCPAGLVPVGINGRSGKWLDAIGFICGALQLEPPTLPKVAAPARPKVTPLAGPPFKIQVEWMRPVPADFIEWYSIEQWKNQRWVTVPSRIDPRQFRSFVEYPDVGDASQHQAFRVCAENSAHRACSPEAWYHSFSTGSAQMPRDGDRPGLVPPRLIEVKPNGALTQARAATAPATITSATAALATANYNQAAPVGLPDLNALAVRGAALAAQDPLAAELRKRTADGALRRGFDVGFGIWEGNAAPGPGKQRIHDALNAAEQPGFDIAAAYSLPRNKYAKLAIVGAAIGNADPAVGSARNAENDVFYWLGFDIASGIFGDPAAGSLGNTATGPVSLGIRNELNAPGQRGFNAATALHLSRHYK